MKLLFACLCFICLSIQAFCHSDVTEHTIEELRQEILSIKEETREVQLHLSKAHKEFRTGTIFYAVGLGLTILAAGADNQSSGLILLGTGFLVTGGILHIDSHKHVGRAGFSKLGSRRLANPR